MKKVDLHAKFGAFEDTWVPRVVAELNGQEVRVSKLLGDFVWHRHEHEDELFLVWSGRLEIELRDRTVTLGPGELFVVPRGVEHRPVARELVEVVLFEPATTRNSGEVENESTIEPQDLERL